MPSLNELHRLIEEAKGRKLQAETESDADHTRQQLPVVAPHTLPPSALYSSHLAPFLAAQHDDIAQRLEDVQGANTSLMTEVAAQRAEMQRLLAALEHVVADVEESSRMMGSGEVQDLVGEVRGLQTELQT